MSLVKINIPYKNPVNPKILEIRDQTFLEEWEGEERDRVELKDIEFEQNMRKFHK